MAYRDIILARSGLLHYWAFDEASGTTAVDGKGSKDVTLTGAALGTTGKVDGTCAYFDGTDDKGVTASIDLSSHQKIVIAGLFKFPNYNNLDDIAFEFGTTFNSAGSFRLDPNCSSPSGEMLAFLFGDTVTNGASYDRPDNDWHHIAIVYDLSISGGAGSSYEVELYIDGVKQSKNTIYGNNNNGYFGNFAFNIACRNGSSLFCEMYLQHLALYSDLSEDEIYDDYIRAFGSGKDFADSDINDSVYGAADTPIQSAGAIVEFDTTAADVAVYGLSELYAYYPSYSHLIAYVDGVYDSLLSFSADGFERFDLSLGSAGITKRVKIVAGTQSTAGGGTALGLFVKGAYCDPSYTLSVVTPSASERIILYGDSITGGANATVPMRYGYGAVLRNDYGRQIAFCAWGYRTLHSDANSAPLLADLVSRLTTISADTVLILIGTNDYALNACSAATFGGYYADLLDGIHAADSARRIICVTPLVRTSEGANSFGDTTGDYRTQISTVVAARAWAELVDGSVILTTGDLSDGVHPTDAGHAKLAEYINGLFQGSVLIDYDQSEYYRKYEGLFFPEYWPQAGPYAEQMVSGSSESRFLKTQKGVINIDPALTLGGISEDPVIDLDANNFDTILPGFEIVENGTDIIKSISEIGYVNDSSLLFDSGDYVKKTISLPYKDDMVFEFIFKPDTGGDSYIAIFGASGESRVYIICDTSDMSIEVTIIDTDLNSQTFVTQNDVVDGDHFYHVMIFITGKDSDDGQKYYIYVNGELLKTDTYSLSGYMAKEDRDFSIGDSTKFNLTMLRFWHRYKWFTGDQVATVADRYNKYITGEQDYPAPIPVTCLMWGDETGSIPAVMVCDNDGVWNLAFHGTSSGDIQPESTELLNGISGVRLCDKYEDYGYCNFDDIKTFDSKIRTIQIPRKYERVIKRIIAQTKTLNSWAVLMIEWI